MGITYKKVNNKFKKMSSDKTPKIRVLVRKRPLSKKEQLKGETDIISIDNNQSVIVREQK